MKWQELIRKQRESMGLTQTELAVKAGVSLPSIQKIEAGKANPALNTLERIFAVLNIKIEFTVREHNQSKEKSSEKRAATASPQKPLKEENEKEQIWKEVGREVTGLTQGSALERAGHLVKIFEKLADKRLRK